MLRNKGAGSMPRYVPALRVGISRTVTSVRRNVRVFWRASLATLANPYRPERHYMRGPGPKYRARRGRGAD